jgi:hypothetical protein
MLFSSYITVICLLLLLVSIVIPESGLNLFPKIKQDKRSKSVAKEPNGYTGLKTIKSNRGSLES